MGELASKAALDGDWGGRGSKRSALCGGGAGGCGGAADV